MPRIKLLPTVVINKIAAGEVIERPASVVKELVENSIDAEATEITIEIEEGGRKLIRVTDNGYGMDREDMELAFRSHSTSKLAQPEDLMHITTMGFRGEALPSIGAVSHASIVSRARGSDTGYEVEISGGGLDEVRRKGCAQGTCVTARNLFFNTPVRLKFIRGESAEMSRVTDIVTRIALAHCHIRFELIHNRRRVFLLLDSEGLADRIRTFFGADVADALLPLESHTHKLNVSGYIAPPSLTRRDTRMQYIYLNSRPIRDRVVFGTLKGAYADYLMSGRSSVVFIFMDMDPREFDVNVHPTKAEVRFRDSSLIRNQLFASVRDVLASAGHAPLAGHAPAPAAPDDYRERVTQSVRDFFSRREDAGAQAPTLPGFTRGSGRPEGFPPPSTGMPPPSAGMQLPPGVRSFCQMHDAFIVVETDGGIEVIDQHALHEKIIYEQLHASAPHGPARQKLLIPETIELSVAEWQNVGRIRESLEGMGFEVAEFGGRSLLISAVPQILGECAAGPLVKDMIDEIQSGGVPADVEELRDAMHKSLACRAAIKAGEPLTPARMNDLLTQMRLLVQDYSCPHGRPLALSLTLEELARRFKRT
jgi:DNA mismatch repair protein MutL